jgi:hypothetical protein
LILFTDRRFDDDLQKYIRLAIWCHKNNKCSTSVLKFLLNISFLLKIEYLLNREDLSYLIVFLNINPLWLCNCCKESIIFCHMNNKISDSVLLEYAYMWYFDDDYEVAYIKKIEDKIYDAKEI